MNIRDILDHITILPKKPRFSDEFDNICQLVRRFSDGKSDMDLFYKAIQQHYGGPEVIDIDVVRKNYATSLRVNARLYPEHAPKDFTVSDVVKFLKDEGWCQLGNRRYYRVKTADLYLEFSRWLKADTTRHVVAGRNAFHAVMREEEAVKRLGVVKGSGNTGIDIYRGVRIAEL